MDLLSVKTLSEEMFLVSLIFTFTHDSIYKYREFIADYASISIRSEQY